MIDEPGPFDEHSPESGLESGLESAPESTRTGNPAVDDVLTSLDGLADLPVDEHVAVFERAHEQLRSALDGPREP